MSSALVAGTAATMPSMHRPIVTNLLRLALMFVTSFLGTSRRHDFE
jgi:hypothetical protein